MTGSAASRLDFSAADLSPGGAGYTREHRWTFAADADCFITNSVKTESVVV